MSTHTSRETSHPTTAAAVPPRCGVVPPYLLEALAVHGEHDVATRARRTLERDTAVRHLRGTRPVASADHLRSMLGTAAPARDAEAPNARRTVADTGNTEDLPGHTVRVEGDPPSGDAAADEAYEGLGATWTCYQDAFGRDSIDGRGLPLLASVHYGQDYDNAFWDGQQMVFGDGDGRVFRRFTASLDVIGHELTHGVTGHTAGLLYRGQSGALNESVSDVFGTIVKQRSRDQGVEDADWLIGAELLADSVRGVALRSMKAPGTAYDDPVLGKDPQPAHMDDYVDTREDNGGVHINSGIPNHAFYLAATAIGGRSWEDAGLIWYDTLTGDIAADCDFATFARLTVTAAAARFGASSSQAGAVADAWRRVGVTPDGGDGGPPAPGEGGTAHPRPTPSAPEDPSSWTPVRQAPPVGASIRVRRTGGVTGVALERTVSLADLTEEDARDWQRVLASREVHELGPRGEPRPDAFSYRVSCPDADVEADLDEPAVPVRVRHLIERALTRGRAAGDAG